MNLIIPFTKDIKFDTNIGEITSISLEHDYTYNNGELLGNFTITGEYKTHEVSINKEPFEYVLPFSVSLDERIIEDTIDLDIRDFTYDIKDKNILTVSIEYAVCAKEEENSRQDDFEELIDKAVVLNNEVIDNTNTRENIDDNAQDILEKSKENEETFVTYHIHIMKENDTIDSICTKYKTNQNILKDYNDISSLTIGDKIIIPEIDE